MINEKFIAMNGAMTEVSSAPTPRPPPRGSNPDPTTPMRRPGRPRASIERVILHAQARQRMEG